MRGARRRLVTATAGAAMGAAILGTTSCGSSSDSPAVSSQPADTATASAANPSGAMTGFLRAASLQDNGQVPAWLATSTDTANLAELLMVYSQFGNGTGSALFWAVKGLHVTGAIQADPTHAQVTLNGPVVWCLGATPTDPTATCSAVNGVSGATDTYAVVSVDGRWKVDIDINASTQLDQNPLASPGARPSASPS